MENRLKELRKAKGLSQEELGKAFGVSRLAYAHWESGKFDPDLETLVKLADYFGTSIDYIYKHDTEPTLQPGREEDPARGRGDHRKTPNSIRKSQRKTRKRIHKMATLK
jgi:transcriptional regulator with XRE-family HTH domain